MARYRFVQFSNLGWRQRFGLAVLAVVGVAAAVAFLLLSVGLAIVLVPVLAVAWLVARWRLGHMVDAAGRPTAPGEPTADARTIEVEYRVIGKDGAEPK